jgi:hypothetical protein
MIRADLQPQTSGADGDRLASAVGGMSALRRKQSTMSICSPAPPAVTLRVAFAARDSPAGPV